MLEALKKLLENLKRLEKLNKWERTHDRGTKEVRNIRKAKRTG